MDRDQIDDVAQLAPIGARLSFFERKIDRVKRVPEEWMGTVGKNLKSLSV